MVSVCFCVVSILWFPRFPRFPSQPEAQPASCASRATRVPTRLPSFARTSRGSLVEDSYLPEGRQPRVLLRITRKSTAARCRLNSNLQVQVTQKCQKPEPPGRKKMSQLRLHSTTLHLKLNVERLRSNPACKNVNIDKLGVRGQRNLRCDFFVTGMHLSRMPVIMPNHSGWAK